VVHVGLSSSGTGFAENRKNDQIKVLLQAWAFFFWVGLKGNMGIFLARRLSEGNGVQQRLVSFLFSLDYCQQATAEYHAAIQKYQITTTRLVVYGLP
jgi:hypothetical protein